MLSYLIIDDERPNRILLKALLADYAHQLQYIGEADGGRLAVQMINGQKPDVIFLDVQMPDLTGFEVLAQLTHMPQVVFVTAYDQYALKAFDENAIDYLLKPVEEQRLARTVDRLNRPTANSRPEAFDVGRLQSLLQQLTATPAPRLQQIAVNNGIKTILVPVAEIAFFQAAEKYVYLNTLEGRKHLIDHTLSFLETALPTAFIRVQKGAIINSHCIAEVYKHFNNRLLIKLKDKPGSEVLTGTSYRQAIREKLLL